MLRDFEIENIFNKTSKSEVKYTAHSLIWANTTKKIFGAVRIKKRMFRSDVVDVFTIFHDDVSNRFYLFFVDYHKFENILIEDIDSLMETGRIAPLVVRDYDEAYTQMKVFHRFMPVTGTLVCQDNTIHIYEVQDEDAENKSVKIEWNSGGIVQ